MLSKHAIGCLENGQKSECEFRRALTLILPRVKRGIVQISDYQVAPLGCSDMLDTPDPRVSVLRHLTDNLFLEKVSQ